MHTNRLFAIGLLGLSIAAATSVSTSEDVFAQGLRGRLRERLEGNSQSSSNPQQTAGQQGYPAQQQSSGEQQYSGQQPSGGFDVSAVTLQTQPGPGGTQMVITPKGMVVPLPGPGVNASTVQVYIGSHGGYWYIDKNGQQVDLTPAVQAMQQASLQAPQSTNVPQYAPQPQVVNNNYAPQQQSSGPGVVGTAAAAGLGAMAGAAIASPNYWNGVPYGTPIHYGANSMPYYTQGGKPVYVNASNNVAEVNQVNNQHATTLQQQQDWYKHQQSSQTSNWKNWQQQAGANPFVRPDYQEGQAIGRNEQAGGSAGGQSGARFGKEAGGVESGGRFGNEAAGGESGGRFGKEAAGGESGGRFGREAGGSESGGRLGRRAAGGESGGRRGRGTTDSQSEERQGGRRTLGRTR